MQKRINMVLGNDESDKLDSIKSAIGLKTTTDTIRYLISSTFLKLHGPIPQPIISPIGTPTIAPTMNPFTYPEPFGQTYSSVQLPYPGSPHTAHRKD
jgi:hypothetical protein